MVPAKWQLLYSLNPMVGIIEGFRWALLRGQTPLDWSSILMSCILVVVLRSAVASWYFPPHGTDIRRCHLTQNVEKRGMGKLMFSAYVEYGFFAFRIRPNQKQMAKRFVLAFYRMSRPLSDLLPRLVALLRSALCHLPFSGAAVGRVCQGMDRQ